MASSSSWPSAASSAITSIDRVRRSSAGLRPDRAPGLLGDEALEIGVEAGLGGLGALDMGVAEHLAAHRHAGGEAVLSQAHDPRESRASARATSSGWSMQGK